MLFGSDGVGGEIYMCIVHRMGCHSGPGYPASDNCVNTSPVDKLRYRSSSSWFLIFSGHSSKAAEAFSSAQVLLVEPVWSVELASPSGSVWIGCGGAQQSWPVVDSKTCASPGCPATMSQGVVPYR